MSITVHGSLLREVAPSLKPENKSVMRMCPVFLSALFMVSTCTTSLKCQISLVLLLLRVCSKLMLDCTENVRMGEGRILGAPMQMYLTV